MATLYANSSGPANSSSPANASDISHYANTSRPANSSDPANTGEPAGPPPTYTYTVSLSDLSRLLDSTSAILVQQPGIPTVPLTPQGLVSYGGRLLSAHGRLLIRPASFTPAKDASSRLRAADRALVGVISVGRLTEAVRALDVVSGNPAGAITSDAVRVAGSATLAPLSLMFRTPVDRARVADSAAATVDHGVLAGGGSGLPYPQVTDPAASYSSDGTILLTAPAFLGEFGDLMHGHIDMGPGLTFADMALYWNPENVFSTRSTGIDFVLEVKETESLGAAGNVYRCSIVIIDTAGEVYERVINLTTT